MANSRWGAHARAERNVSRLQQDEKTEALVFIILPMASFHPGEWRGSRRKTTGAQVSPSPRRNWLRRSDAKRNSDALPMRCEVEWMRALLRAAAPELPRDAGAWLDLGGVGGRLVDRAAACAALGRA